MTTGRQKHIHLHMSPDILLVGETSSVRVEAGTLDIAAADVEISVPERRGGAMGRRRALVHGPGDQLVLNWSSDYTGGVRIEGKVVVSDLRIALKTELPDLGPFMATSLQEEHIRNEPHPSVSRASVMGSRASVAGSPRQHLELDVDSEICLLRKEIAQLKAFILKRLNPAPL